MKCQSLGEGKAKELALDIGHDVAGAMLFALGIHTFTAPNHIAPGGVTGISTIINYFIPALPIGTLGFIINIPLLILAWKFLGKRFTFNTLKTLAICTVMLDYVFARVPVYEGDPLLASIFGGISLGCGLGIIFMRGSTTGGTDIVVRFMQRKFPYIQMGKIMLGLDFCVLVTAAIAFNDIERALYGLITIYSSSRMVDTFLYGADQGQMVFIVSDKGQEIADAVMAQVGRGVTMLHSFGAYSKLDRPVAMCAVRKPEFYKVKHVIQSIDPTAFIIVGEASEIIGQGFKPIAK